MSRMRNPEYQCSAGIKMFMSFEIMCEFPRIRGTLLEVPIIRTKVFWGLYWGAPILGNYHVKVKKKGSMC